jgi:hypothetical protein
MKKILILILFLNGCTKNRPWNVINETGSYTIKVLNRCEYEVTIHVSPSDQLYYSTQRDLTCPSSNCQIRWYLIKIGNGEWWVSKGPGAQIPTNFTGDFIYNINKCI